MIEEPFKPAVISSDVSADVQKAVVPTSASLEERLLEILAKPPPPKTLRPEMSFAQKLSTALAAGTASDEYKKSVVFPRIQEHLDRPAQQALLDRQARQDEIDRLRFAVEIARTSEIDELNKQQNILENERVSGREVRAAAEEARRTTEFEQQQQDRASIQSSVAEGVVGIGALLPTDEQRASSIAKELRAAGLPPERADTVMTAFNAYRAAMQQAQKQTPSPETLQFLRDERTRLDEILEQERLFLNALTVAQAQAAATGTGASALPNAQMSEIVGARQLKEGALRAIEILSDPANETFVFGEPGGMIEGRLAAAVRSDASIELEAVLSDIGGAFATMRQGKNLTANEERLFGGIIVNISKSPRENMQGLMRIIAFAQDRERIIAEVFGPTGVPPDITDAELERLLGNHLVTDPSKLPLYDVGAMSGVRANDTVLFVGGIDAPTAAVAVEPLELSPFERALLGFDKAVRETLGGASSGPFIGEEQP
jgi:hypothetical protein